MASLFSSNSMKVKDDLKDMIEERRSMRRLRQDLEKVRLLCELIRKREQRKRDLVVAQKQITEVQLTPFMYFLRAVTIFKKACESCPA